MRALLCGLGLVALISFAGCAAAEAERPSARVASASPTPLTDAWVSAPREVWSPPKSRSLAQHGSILIGEPAPPPAPTRPRSQGRVEVSFHRADLENALRFLADSGRFNLVVESGITGQVTASLRGVDAYDALVTIAEANGAEVRYDHGIVMVRRPASKR